MKQILFLVFTFWSSVAFCQQHNESIVDGIKLLGKAPQKTRDDLYRKGYQLLEQSKRVDEYLFPNTDPLQKFTVVYKNQKVDVVSWTENLQFITVVANEIKNLGFESSPFERGADIFSFKNEQRKLLITLILHKEENVFYVTIGKPNSK